MSNTALSRLRPEISKLHAYAVPDADGFVKLDAMENPYKWPEGMRSLWLDYLGDAQVNRYPEPNPEKLKKKLQSQFGPSSECEILFGNGSDELIQLLVIAIAKPGASIVTVSPSFSMYQMIAEFIGIDCHVVPLTEDYELNVDATIEAINQYDPSLVFLAYPNNPTGNLWDRSDVNKVVQTCQGIVVIDEAYGPFASDSFTEELKNIPNMVLLRTASKIGLAGIRFGWLAGDAELLNELNKLRLPYNINSLTQLTVEFALDNFQMFEEQAKIIQVSRAELFKNLSSMKNVHPYKSEANFILFKLLSMNANDVFKRLLDQKVLIKNVSQQEGLSQCLRVTVGTEEENNQFCKALEQALVS